MIFFFFFFFVFFVAAVILVVVEGIIVVEVVTGAGVDGDGNDVSGTQEIGRVVVVVPWWVLKEGALVAVAVDVDVVALVVVVLNPWKLDCFTPSLLFSFHFSYDSSEGELVVLLRRRPRSCAPLLGPPFSSPSPPWTLYSSK